MTQLTTHPTRDRALQAGASNHWEYNGSTLVNSVSGGLTLTPNYTLKTAYNFGRFWARGGARYEPNVYARLPNDTRLPANFGVFAYFYFNYIYNTWAGDIRTMVALFLAEGVEDGGVVSSVSVSLHTLETHCELVFTHYDAYGEYADTHTYRVTDNRVTTVHCYVCMTSTDGAIRVSVAMPGKETITHDFYVGGGEPYISGFGGAPFANSHDYRVHDSALAVSTVTDMAMSDACLFDRRVGMDEMFEWAHLLETGMSPGGRLLPPNNARASLPSAITAADTLITLGADAIKFPSPGPQEQGRVTLIDPNDPDVFEVCALIANDLNQIELVRGVEGTVAQDWGVGTYVRSYLTRGLLGVQATALPEYAYPPPASGYGIPWAGLQGKPDIGGLEVAIADLTAQVNPLSITAATWLVPLPDSNRIQEIAPFAVSSNVKYIAWGDQKVYAGSSVDQLNEIYFGNGIVAMAVGNDVALFIDATDAILSTSDGVSVSSVATAPVISGLTVGGFVFREAEEDFLLYAMDPQTITPSAYTSADGQTWTDVTSTLSVPAGTVLQALKWLPGADLYYGILASTTGQEVWNATSSDGLTWTAVAADPAAMSFNTVAYCPTSGRYVGMGALDMKPYYSDDGMLTFNPMPDQVSGVTVFLRGVQWVTDLGLFVAVSRMPTRWDGVLIVSRDGVQWEPVIVVRDINLGGPQSAPETLYWDAARKVLALGAHSGVAYFARVTA